MNMLNGICTLTYLADDVAVAADWYAGLLGQQPYFRRDPGYVEFRVGPDRVELGIMQRASARAADGSPAGTEPGGVIAYWEVDDLEQAWDRLLHNGCTGYQPITERGEGFATATVLDPFGNLLGIMRNPHYREQLDARVS